MDETQSSSGLMATDEPARVTCAAVPGRQPARHRGVRLAPARAARAPAIERAAVGDRAARVGGRVAAARRPAAVVRDSRTTLHVQLGRLRRPGQHRGVQGRVRRRRTSSTTSTPTTRSCWPSSRAARRAVRHRAARRPSSCRAWSRQGFIQKLDWSKIPNFAVHQPAVQEPVVGPEQRVPRPEGLGHDRHPDPVARSSPTTSSPGSDFFDVAPKYSGKDRRRRLAGRRLHGAAQVARLLAQLGRSRRSSTRPAKLLHGPRPARPRARLGHVRGASCRPRRRCSA